MGANKCSRNHALPNLLKLRKELVNKDLSFGRWTPQGGGNFQNEVFSIFGVLLMVSQNTVDHENFFFSEKKGGEKDLFEQQQAKWVYTTG